jgi:hypothetical protein
MSVRERRMGGADGRTGGLMSGRARSQRAASATTWISFVGTVAGSSTAPLFGVRGQD